jgi:hypothetical protein
MWYRHHMGEFFTIRHRELFATPYLERFHVPQTDRVAGRGYLRHAGLFTYSIDKLTATFQREEGRSLTLIHKTSQTCDKIVEG